jgi:hypothetical protein
MLDQLRHILVAHLIQLVMERRELDVERQGDAETR